MPSGILTQGTIVSQPMLDNTPAFTTGSIPIVTGWVDIAYSTDTNVYCAISTTLGGQCSVATSSNGKDWNFKKNILPPSGTYTWKTIAYGNGIFLAATNGDMGAYSDDSGNTWHTVKLPAGDWSKIVFGTSYFVIMPRIGTSTIHSSIAASTAATFATSATNWITKALPVIPATSYWTDITNGINNNFLIIANTKDAAYMDTINGATSAWVAKVLPSGNWNSVTFGTSNFIMVGDRIVTTQGFGSNSTWVERVSPTVDSWTTISLGNISGAYMIVAVSTGNSNIAAYSEDGISWSQQTLATTSNWSAITHGSVNGFVAISSNGSLTSTSIDGLSWKLGSIPVIASWTGLNYNEETFVSVSSNNNVIAKSPDGLTWVHRKLPSILDWTGMAYGNGYFMTVANNSDSVAYSSDTGDSWKISKLPKVSDWASIEYQNSTFVVIDSVSAASSIDNGLTWTVNALPVSTSPYHKVIATNGVFVAITNSSTFAYSLDGNTWVAVLVPNATWVDICVSKDLFVAVDLSNANIITSTNGKIWREQQGPILNQGIKKVNFGNGRYILTYSNNITYSTSDFITYSNPISTIMDPTVSAYGEGVSLYLSNTDATGILTSTSSLPFADSWAAVTWGTIGYIAIMQGNGIYSTSVDGNTWIQRNLPSSGSWVDAEANPDGTSVVIISNNIKALYSSDGGETFISTNLPKGPMWQSVAYGDKCFVAVSNGTETAVSNDEGRTWSLAHALPVNGSWKIIYANNYFIAISSKGNVLKSTTKASSWIPVTSVPNATANMNICYGNSILVVTNSTNIVYTSIDDGLTWQKSMMPGNYTWRKMAFGVGDLVIASVKDISKGVFVAIAPNSNKYATSVDGITWNVSNLLNIVEWKDITYNSGTFIAIASNSTDIAKIDFPINNTVYVCPPTKVMSGKLLITFNDFDPLISSIKTCSVRVNDMNFRVGLASNNSSASNVAMNSVEIPLVLGSNQVLRLETANPEAGAKFILTGYED